MTLIFYNVKEYTTQLSLLYNEEFAKAEEATLAEYIKSANEVLEKHAKDTGDINVTVEDLISKEALMDKPNMKKYYEYVMDYHFIVSDIVSFIRTIQNFISQHLQDLSTLNPENYVAALYHFLNREDNYKVIANPLSGTGDFYDKEPVILKYVPRETEPGSGQYKIYEQYETHVFMTLLKTVFFKALDAGHLIRRCQYCKKYFITTKDYHTKYCNNTIPGRPDITPFIKSAMYDFMSQNVGAFSISKHTMAKIRKIQRMYYTENKSPEDIAKELDIKLSNVNDYINYNTHSLSVHDLLPEDSEDDP